MKLDISLNFKTRPEKLFSLFGGLKSLKKIGPKTEKKFNIIGYKQPIDLLFLIPNYYIFRESVDSLLDVNSSYASLKIKVLNHEYNNYQKIKKVRVQDEKTEFFIVFFNFNERYLKQILPINQIRIISGKVETYMDEIQMVHPDYILKIEESHLLDEIDPIYPVFKSMSQRLIKSVIKEVLLLTPKFEEWICNDVLQEKKWPSFNYSINEIHNPKYIGIDSIIEKCRERLAYDEVFSKQIIMSYYKYKNKINKKEKTVFLEETRKSIFEKLPFELTNGQKKSINQILKDIQSPLKMNRLLQGDVGTGKTIVAFITMCLVAKQKSQAAIMAPTEVLIKQHYNNFIKYFESLNLRIIIFTGSDKGKVRLEKLKKILNGSVDIIFGTHSLFQKDVFFNKLKLVVIDEQHKFGVKQRVEMAKKGKDLDILVMSATPIPRSLSFAKYGDLDFSEIREKPKERKKIKTLIISDNKIDKLVERIGCAISNGEKVYWVCPLIEESESLNSISVKTRFDFLRKNIPSISIDFIHGQMDSIEKNRIINDFSEGKIKLLVSTTVIEVGMDVADASIMVIEGAERFGLAQLHQLRGRIGRGKKDSTCLLIYSSNATSRSIERLIILRENDDGFDIAEKDLVLRGGGVILGSQQSGFETYKFLDFVKHRSLFELANKETKDIFSNSLITKKKLEALNELIHLMQIELANDFIEFG